MTDTPQLWKVELNLRADDCSMLTAVLKSTADIYLELQRQHRTEKIGRDICSILRILRALEEGLVKSVEVED